MNTTKAAQTASAQPENVRLESLMDAGTHFFNGDRLETAKSELEGHRATIYHQWPSRQVETLFVTILECKPNAILCRWHDWSAGVTREQDLQGANIQNWIIGAKRNDI